ncbi:exosortase E/protease, VPEID-CTERM system [Tritonibacter multivorans]|uniref:Exosortase E/protease, VPEID-CTERM system n=1 Tax=Tritonibacter multivorans TaxID=928856 RepID=A0A0P1GAF2_9RHOB|nr:exosortase E/protease, VPEID-CTERM system [Tritonibacter multivorans]MDA7422075.1 exosortase E/protease, VPEID-CTERM system [Tritonibacter multivorans]CUH78517.1 exosortase E/protease, VPEID-CTERM system [Tritonibacter multivorans]SFD17939.1 hypothetical protein SAMN04488049_10892 [Tritonibacter multivorans]
MKPISRSSTVLPTGARRQSAFWAIVIACGLLVLELAAIGAVFKHAIDFTCRENWPFLVCRALDRGLIATYGMLGALTCLLALAPRTLDGIGSEGLRGFAPLRINLLGVALAFVPMALMRQNSGLAGLLPSLVIWGIALTLILRGLGLWLAPGAVWRRFAREHGLTLLVCALVGALLPWATTYLRPLWRLDLTTDITFSAVTFVIQSLGYDLMTEVETKVMGSGGFFVEVGAPCAGLEGIALTTGFVTLYLWLFRDSLRFPRALLLYPFGICVSFMLNILRISILLVIGFEGNPEFAIGGFHSHAGWLMFTFVALGVVLVSSTFAWLRKPTQTEVATRGQSLPVSRDPVAAKILPFAIFMFSALLANNLSPTPGVLYPLRMLMMAAALWLFWPVLRQLPWRLDPIAIGLGAAIGLGWVLIPVTPAETPPYAALTGAALLLWFVARGIGTVLLVPVIEELFFRDYLESKLQVLEGRAGKCLAAAVTAGLFAVLHDRWMEALIAGLLFSYLVQRAGGRVTDAIVAHGVANLLVFAVAVAIGNLALI